MAQTDWAGAAAGRFDAQALEAYIQQYQQQEQIPGISVCVTGPQGVLFEKGFGKRNDKGDPMTADTIPAVIDDETPQQAIVSALRKYTK